MRGLRFALLVSVVALTACSSVSNQPDPSPLPVIESKVQPKLVWKNEIGSETEFRFQPVFSGDLVAVVGGKSQVALLDRNSGQTKWKITLPQEVAGGVGVGSGLLAVGSLKGDVTALDVSNGKIVWTVKASSEVISAPVVANDLVIVRSNDGKVTAFSASTGTMKWIYQRQQPPLQLRNYAAPIVAEGIVYVGQAAGRLSALAVDDGRVLWEAPIALPRGASELERVTDIVAPPVVHADMVCAVAFQGRIACINTKNGSLIWTRDVSSWSGLAIDERYVYVSDVKGHISAFERNTGRSVWKQEKLAYRFVSGPAVLGNQVVVGDLEGYLHYLDPEDGSLVGRLATDGSRIYLAPQSNGSQAVVQTSKGGLYLLGAQ
ncbi:outer membrane protein assembly factor BamB [Chitinibacter bivalviorum]|uniref:Outer membrane protein assembly factor BamB n=1 Tax=Chitinibacter bivalviorum TaxID=2739434 RepID=A0A7H9BGT1_9NEIS|nr:outer membrane protein assembly factor BamB [Chitinibacter bivalviorum]QLG87920.1 outer membrane protein assembly factor BamB [Chitinibacter bivalviorum]